MSVVWAIAQTPAMKVNENAAINLFITFFTAPEQKNVAKRTVKRPPKSVLLN
jgi:hypothetical protein